METGQFLDAHYIYIDPVSGRYGFLYYPEPVEGMALSGLLVYLSAHLDLHDKSTASAIFRLIPLSSGTNFILREEQLDFLFHLPQRGNTGFRRRGRERKNAYI